MIAPAPSNSGQEHRSSPPSTGTAPDVPRGWFVSGEGLANVRGPLMTADVEVGGPIPALRPDRTTDGSPFAAVHALVRLHGHPLGMVVLPVPDGASATGEIDAQIVAEAVWAELAAAVEGHLRQDGLTPPDGLTAAGLPVEHETACSWQRRLGDARPTAAICIATCGRSLPDLFRTVRSALNQSYDEVEVLVVDNRPTTSRLPEALFEAFPDEPRLRYAVEPVRGLAAVRNRSMRESDAEILALTDEDVDLDRDWLGFLTAAFDQPNVACVTGLILPSELETRAQLLIEEFGGFSKGFERRRWDLADNRLDHPLFPYILGIYGSGANAAWRRSALQAIGGYDEHLGTGTPARSGEDADIYLSCLRSGHQLVYEPAALVRHAHRRDLRLVRRQVFDYGVGLGAVLTKRFLDRAERRDMLARLPAGLNYLLRPSSPKNAGKQANFPRSLTIAEWLGILYGPFAYVGSRRSRRRHRALSRKSRG